MKLYKKLSLISVVTSSILLSSGLYATTPSELSLTKLYIGTFDRAPDSAGIKYWINYSNLELEDIARSFFDQVETKKMYPDGITNSEFIASAYKNLFKRTADEAGAEYWLNELDSGNMDKSVFLLAIINGAKEDDKAILDNKTTVGLEFGRAGLNDVSKAISAMRGVTADSVTVSSSICGFIPSRCEVEVKEEEDSSVTLIKQTEDEVTTPIIPAVSTPKETTTPTESTNGVTAPDIRAMTVKGSVVDGIIYDGKINVSDMSGNSLGSTITDDKGGYSLYIPQLPKQYKVSVSDGRDAGSDGVKNENDRDSSFGMSAIVDREDSGDDSMANISPATTVVADIAEDGAIGVDDARDMVNDSLGLEKGTKLSKIDPTNSDKANRAGAFFAMLSEMMPTTNKRMVFKSIAKVIITKKIKVKISNTTTDIDELALEDIARGVSGISEDSIQKVIKSKVVIRTVIKRTIESTEVAKNISRTSQNLVLSHRASWRIMLKKMDSLDLDMLNSDDLSLFSNRVQESMHSILEDSDSLNVTEPYSVELIGDMVDRNLDLDSAVLASKMVKVSQSYQKIKIKIKNSYKITHKIKLNSMIAKIYKNSDLNSLDSLSADLEDDSKLEAIDSIIGEIESKTASDTPDVEDTMQDIIASKITSDKVEDGSIPTEDTLKDIIADDGLYESVKKVVKIKREIKTKTTITQEDRVKLVSSSTVMQSIKASVQSKTYTKIDSSATDAMLANLNSTLLEARSDIEEYKNRLLALQISLADLTKAFNSATYSTKVSNSINAVKKIKTTSTVSVIKTIKKIKIVIVKRFVTDTTATIDESDVDNQIVIPDPVVRTIRLPQPMLESLPIQNIRFTI
ncbi:MAG: DUF4214 domain-containing protein [Sulfurovum sp.]|nr:DUF4214 domain-containing protein [Sulfurovaceae bacterium]